MKARLQLFIVPMLVPMAFVGCQTVDDQAPMEVRAAQQSLEKAGSKDVDDVMPSAYEAAERKFAASLDLLSQSSKFQRNNETTQAKTAHDAAIQAANESKAISDNGIALVEDMKSFDENSGSYIAVADKATKVDALQRELDASKTRLAQLEGQNAGLTRDKADLANRPAEVITKIPADFRVAKTMAYFKTGSTTLDSKYRRDIQDLAQMLMANPEFQVKLEGFADPRGSAAVNQRLATKRIDVVAQELKAQGVKPEQIQSVVVGETSESASGQDRGALQLDRKVTATISAVAH